jgi:hypothetical protein
MNRRPEGRNIFESTIFCDITPCSPLKVDRRFGGTCRSVFTLVSCSAYSALKMEAVCYSETSMFSGLRGVIHSACRLLSRSFLARLYSSTLKTEAIRSSETSVNFQRTTRRYIPEDSTVHNHRCENLKSYIETFSFTKITQ